MLPNGQRRLLKTRQRPQTRHHKLSFLMTNQRRHVIARHQSCRDVVHRNRMSRKHVEDFKIQTPTDTLKHLSFALLLHTENNIRTRAIHLVVKLEQQLRFLFEIAVEQKHKITTRVDQASHHRLVVSEVAREIDDPNARIFPVQLECDFERVIRWTIVDKNDFVIVSDLACRPANAVVKLLEVRRGVIQSRHYRQHHLAKLFMYLGASGPSLNIRSIMLTPCANGGNNCLYSGYEE